MKVTIQSMAKDLGLSRNTVSLALKNSSLVAQHTKDKVQRYARKSGYMEELPQEQKTVLKRTPHYHIMILRKSDEAVYWDKVINGIAEEASRSGCYTHVAVLTEEEEREGRFPLGLDEKINAVFCVKLPSGEYLKKLKDSGYLIIQLDDYCDQEQEPMGDVVRVEGVKAVACLTRHLISQGMRRIGFLNENSFVYETMHERYLGYLEAMNFAGIPLDPELLKTSMQSDHFYYQSTFDEIVESYSVVPEAVVCGNDQIALCLTRAFRKKGLRVPEDVAVTGFDDNEDMMMDPFFTTVHVDAKWLGRRMVQIFLWRLQNPDAPREKVVVSCDVIIRASSCKDISKTEKG